MDEIGTGPSVGAAAAKSVFEGRSDAARSSGHVQETALYDQLGVPPVAERDAHHRRQ